MMARSKYYKELMNSNRWRKLRVEKLTANPCCQECAKQGYVVAATEVHHIVPIESDKLWSRMKDLAYRWSNLESVCKQCHHQLHKEMASHAKKTMIKRKMQEANEFCKKYFIILGGGVFFRGGC